MYSKYARVWGGGDGRGWDFFFLKGNLASQQGKYRGQGVCGGGTHTHRLTELHGRLKQGTWMASLSPCSGHRQKGNKKKANKRRCPRPLASSQLLMHGSLSGGEAHTAHTDISHWNGLVCQGGTDGSLWGDRGADAVAARLLGWNGFGCLSGEGSVSTGGGDFFFFYAQLLSLTGRQLFTQTWKQVACP